MGLDPLNKLLVASGKNAAKAEVLRLMNRAIVLGFVSGCGVLKLRSIFNIVVLFCRFRRSFTRGKSALWHCLSKRFIGCFWPVFYVVVSSKWFQ